MDFSNPDELLEFLLTDDTSLFPKITELCESLVEQIEVKHINGLGNEFPSAFSQCILECFKIKYGFKNHIWFSTKKFEETSFKSDAKPIKFSRLGRDGSVLDYELYNLDQALEDEIAKITPEKKEKKKSPTVKVEVEPKKEYTPLEIKTAILACVKAFSEDYGKSGVSKILKGSGSLQNTELNNRAMQSKYFGILGDLTLKKIREEIDCLLKQGLLLPKKIGAFGRPVLKLNPEINFSEEDFNIGNFLVEREKEEEDDDENFKKIVELISLGKNIFLTGHAGTGKSYILNKLKRRYPDLTITSTTGIAAVNVKGQTLHSWAGIGICNRPVWQTVDKILKNRTRFKQIKDCEILAIDEISMLDIKTFEYTDRVLKEVRGNEEPFGGIQVIFIGDFFQLPPVNNLENSERSYCFDSSVWEKLDLQTVLLTKNYRQNEENLINALANMRTNSMTDEDIKLLQSREYYFDDDLSDILHIFSTNEEADRYNAYKYASIDSKEHLLTAFDGVYHGKSLTETPTSEREQLILKRIDSVCRAERVISLKVGARVMLLINKDFDRCLINGSCGVVREIEEDYVLVEFDNGETAKIIRHDFEFYNNETLIAVRKQFPLRSAYAITIHKSQGMSLDKLVVDCARIFERGQAYVAISRIKTLDGLYLRNFDPNKVMVDEKVCEFYNTLKITNR